MPFFAGQHRWTRAGTARLTGKQPLPHFYNRDVEIQAGMKMLLTG